MPLIDKEKQRELHEDFDKLGYFTSDHAIQKAKVEDIIHGINIRVASWNTMNQCHGIDGYYPYSNNPLNIFESTNQYKARKLIQIDEIISQIEQSNANNEALDVFFLQEIDWFRMNDTEVLRNLQDATHKEIFDYFCTRLNNIGWGFVGTSPTKRGANISQQMLLTLYNKFTLTPTDEKTGVFPVPSTWALDKRRNRGFSHGFKTNNGDEIELVNFHLDYEFDHRKQLLDSMELAIAKGKMIVMGGDSNHAPNYEIDSLTGDWQNATAVDLDMDQLQETRKVLLTTKHKTSDGLDIEKHYDGFCAGSTGITRIHKAGGAHFFINKGVANVEEDTVNSNHPFHQSELGMPWMRGRALMSYLDTKLQLASSDMDKQIILAKMADIAYRRFGETLEEACHFISQPLVETKKYLDTFSFNRIYKLLGQSSYYIAKQHIVNLKDHCNQAQRLLVDNLLIKLHRLESEFIKSQHNEMTKQVFVAEGVKSIEKALGKSAIKDDNVISASLKRLLDGLVDSFSITEENTPFIDRKLIRPSEYSVFTIKDTIQVAESSASFIEDVIPDKASQHSNYITGHP